MDKVREVALKALYDIIENDSYSNITVSNLLKRANFGSLERRFVTELVYGTIKYKTKLEWIRDQFIRTKKIDKWINYIILMGIYQLIFLDKVPDSAACNESVKIAKKYGNPGSVKFVNGVLRNIARNKDNISYPDIEINPILHISVVYSHPQWLVKRWIEEYGVAETIKICKHNNSKSPNTIRANTLKTSIEELESILVCEGISVSKTKYSQEGFEIEGFEQLDKVVAFIEGLFTMQDEASMLVARCLNPAPNSLIVDGCAAPGSKTTHLAQIIGDQGEILAFDIHGHKLKLIEQNAKRLGISSIKAQQLEAQKIGHFYENAVDYMLLDVPCSGLGVLRRRADLRWKKSYQQIVELSKLQYQILEGAANALKLGGVIVYSTCTMTYEENFNVVNSFLQKNRSFMFDNLLPHLPNNLSKEDPIICNTAKNGYIQILPQRHNMDGFFIARIKRSLS